VWPPPPGAGGTPRYYPGSQPDGNWPIPLPQWSGPTAGYGSALSYKGERYHLPQSGSGALAGQWRRLGARMLDGLMVLPAIVVVFIPFIAYAANHTTAISDSTNNASGTVPVR
jgi:hypothetical protein